MVEELGYGNQDDASNLEEVYPENDDWVLERLTTSHLQMVRNVVMLCTMYLPAKPGVDSTRVGTSPNLGLVLGDIKNAWVVLS